MAGAPAPTRRYGDRPEQSYVATSGPADRYASPPRAQARPAPLVVPGERAAPAPHARETELDLRAAAPQYQQQAPPPPALERPTQRSGGVQPAPFATDGPPASDFAARQAMETKLMQLCMEKQTVRYVCFVGRFRISRRYAARVGVCATSADCRQIDPHAAAEDGHGGANGLSNEGDFKGSRCFATV